MTKRRRVVVVDGSNLATEGRTLPSLKQLDEAVTAFLEEYPDSDVVVVVDATFEHRVSAAERERVKKAELDGDIVTPPAGAIGRGDAFVLKVALRADGVVLSNDSFQEFHAEHPWLFEEGRLIGGKPVPRIGWIFTPRLPVRGPRSKSVTKKAARASAAEESSARAPRPAPEAPRPATRTRGAAKALAAAAEETTAEATAAPAKAPRAGSSSRPAKAAPTQKRASAKSAAPAATESARTTSARRAVKKVQSPTTTAATTSASRRPARGAAPRERSSTPASAAPTKSPAPAREAKAKAPRASKAPAKPAEAQKARTPTKSTGAGAKDRSEPVNTPRSYRTLVADHAIGSTVKGEVAQFTSHGALVSVAVGRTMRVVCYAPLAGLGTPAPTRARDVLKAGAEYDFAIVAFDPTRRRAELKLIA